MARILKYWFLFVFYLVPTSVRSASVLGYDFRYALPSETPLSESQSRAHPKGERYSALVIVPDFHLSGAPLEDDLRALLIANYYSGYPKWLDRYLASEVQPFYAGLISADKRTYGEQSEEVAKKVLQSHAIQPQLSSMVILTEYRNPNRVLATLRIDVEDENGLLPSEHAYGLRAPREVKENNLIELPKFVFTGELPFLNIQNQQKSFKKIGMASAAVELKTWAVADEVRKKKFFIYAYLIAKRHRLFHLGANGNYVSTIVGTGFGRVIPRFHESIGLTIIESIQNEVSYGLPMSLAAGSTESFFDGAKRQERLLPDERKWLVLDPLLIDSMAGCGMSVVSAGKRKK